jgi:hypothetical protein
MSGGAIAATGGFSSGGKLQACVNEEGGLKLLKAGKKCKKGQKTVAWDQTGPAGAQVLPAVTTVAVMQPARAEGPRAGRRGAEAARRDLGG